MVERAFSVLEEAILDELAIYQFLTAKQLLRLGVSKDRKRIYQALASLRGRKPKVVEHIEFGALPGHGTLSAMYALTPIGGRLLEERYRQAISVPAHKRVDTFKNDYWHRMWSADFHIAARRWADEHGHAVEFYHSYFDPMPGGERGKRLERKTRVTFGDKKFEPDAIFSLLGTDGKRRLFVFELYVGTRTKRVVEQLTTHLYAMGEDAIEHAYQATSAARHLVVFDTQADLELVARRLRDHPWFADANDVFFLSTRDAVEVDWFRGWQHFDGEVVNLI